MECRDESGCAKKGISYYANIRTVLPVHYDYNEIHIRYPCADIIIHTTPFLVGEVQFLDTDRHFPESIRGGDMYAHVMDEYDCPVDLDDASCINGKVSLIWDHNHLMDIPYQIGYFLPRPKHEQMLWEYRVSGPAQVHVEAMNIIDAILPQLITLEKL
jgi:hypothetical protein